MAKKTAQELVTTHPGVRERRHQLILALCQNPAVAVGFPVEDLAIEILLMANTLIEETEQ